MAEIKWIKITTDIFDDEKILLIENMPESDSMIVIWFKLLAFAGKSNNNGVFMLSDKIAYTDEMLATIFRRPLNTVRMALQTFEMFGMIEINDGVISIANWDKHQNVEGMDKIREQNRIRVAKHREQQKLKALGCNVTGNVTVTEGNAIEEDKEEDKEKDKEEDKKKEKEKEKKKIYEEIVSYLNEKANTRFRPTGKETQRHINARLNEGFTVEDFKTVIDKKVLQWLNDNEMAQYLRPETLFGTKFESYLNAPVSTPKTNGGERIEIIDGKEYLFKNGHYYIPGGSNIAVNPFVKDDLPF